MHILVLSQYFWPEPFVINDLVRHLAKQGHTITVLTGKPNYPDGHIYQGYSKSGVQHEIFADTVNIYRVPIRLRGPGKGKDLLLNYLSFIWSGLIHFPRITKKIRIDAILVFAPSPITSAIPAIPIKWQKKAHLAIWVQDLWPESLLATEFIRNPIILKIVGWLVRCIYFFADTLLVQSQAFYTPVTRYARADKIVYYPNSVDSTIIDSNKKEKLPEEFCQFLETHFCLIFAGNIGTAQSVETLVAVAQQLKDLVGFKLVIVGSGSMMEWLCTQKKTHQLDNLELAGRYPMEMMSQIYSRAAGLVVTLKDKEIFSYTIPSKIQGYLAAGKPIVAALNGEGARIINEAGAGLTCGAEDTEGLADSARMLYAMSKEERAQMGAKGREYFLQHFEMRLQSARLVKILEQRILALKEAC